MLQFSAWKFKLQRWITDKVSPKPPWHEAILKHASL